jgi:hypothetical protein
MELKSNNLFKIFLLISLFLIFRTHKIVGIVLLIFVVLYFCSNYSEKFTETNMTVDKVIENINPDKLKYGHTVNVIRLEELCSQIVKKAKTDRKLFETIKQKVIKIYGEINNNSKLANYLKFNNLINNENLPIFINESPDVYLSNEVKIILLTMDKNDFENIII